MKIHRFYFEFEDEPSIIEIKEASLVHQMHRVLKLTSGEQITLFNSKKREAAALIKDISKTAIRAEVIEYKTNTTESQKHVTLYCAILKKENFELVVQKAVEIGVTRIIPIRTARTIKQNVRPERVRQIIIEAAEQSGRGIIPLLGNSLIFSEALAESLKTNDRTFFFDQSGVTSLAKIFKQAGIFIGPEGGWTEGEIKEAKDSGADIISFGPLTYRAETAAIVSVFTTLN